MTQRKTVLRGGLVAAAGLLAVALLAIVVFPGTVSAHGGPGAWFGGRGAMAFGGADRDGLLADALGITPEKLQAARVKAAEAAVRQALDNERIDQEQADRMLAAIRVAPYLDNIDLTASALGMTAAELEAAREDGKSLSDLMDEKDLDRTALQEKMQSARDAAIDKAVADGAITSDQAETLKEGVGGCGMGMGGFGGHLDGMGFRGRHGPMDLGDAPWGRGDESGVRGTFRMMPGRASLGSSLAPRGWSGARGAYVAPSDNA